MKIFIKVNLGIKSLLLVTTVKLPALSSKNLKQDYFYISNEATNEDRFFLKKCNFYIAFLQLKFCTL